MAHGAVEPGLAVVLGTLAGDDEHREVARAVTLHIHVLRIVDGHAVHHEVVGVDLRGREGDLDGPDVVLAAGHVDGAAVGIGHPGTAELDDGGIVGLQAEGHAVALDLRGDDGGLAAEIEIGQFLRHGSKGKGSRSCDQEDSLHNMMLL